jgi:hypothetical protein
VPGSATGGSGGGDSGGGSSGAGPAGAPDFAIGGGNLEPFGLINEGIGVFEGFDWAVPALILTVPGLLLILAVLSQVSVGILWLPVVRRWLGGFGVGGRRRQRT